MGERGRRKGANGERSRSVLLAIAASEFACHGYHNTKISTIVQKANVTQPTFYLYFASKEAIFQELVEHFRLQLGKLVTQARLESGLRTDSIEKEIKYGLTAVFSFFKANQDLTVIGFYKAKEAVEVKEQMAIQIEKNLIMEQNDGYFRKDIDMKMVAESIVGIAERLTKTKLFNDLIEPENLAKEIVDLLLYGMITKNESCRGQRIENNERDC